MKVGYEVDKVKLYNFMKNNDITSKDLSTMLGKSQSYVSQVMTGRMNLSDDTLEKLADLMGVDENEIIATSNSLYLNENPGRRKRTVEDVKGEEPDEEPRPTFEQRMEEMIMTDEERRNRFFSTQAFIDEVKKRTGMQEIVNPKDFEYEDSSEDSEDRVKAKIEALTRFLSNAIVHGKKYIGTLDLVSILVGSE